MAPPAVTNAAIDPGDPHVVAVQFRHLTCGPGATPDCTGTLVAPRVVVTAAHCVDNSPPEGFQVFVGTDVDAAGEVVYVTDLEPHPLYDPVSLENDLAVLVLAAPLPHPPAPLLASLDDAAVGRLARVVGFGADSSTGVPGVKRTGAATITAVADASFDIAPGPSMSCHGDSGGPVFLDVDGVEYLAGVTSSGDPACVSHGTNVRVDVHRDGFLQPAIDAANALPTDPVGGPVGAADASLCDQRCATDDDCPADHTCSDRGDGMRCRYQDFPAGYLDGSPCGDEDACPEGLCAAVERDGAPVCVCYTLCPEAAAEPDPTGCGCDATHAATGPAWALLAAVVVRRMRRIARQPEASCRLASTPRTPPPWNHRTRNDGTEPPGA